MLSSIYSLARSALFAVEPETAHEMTLKALEAGVFPRPTAADDPALAQTLMGLSFPNPIAIAAGFDKDARVADAVLAMGCGFAEVGTITPLPQIGNPQPRVFRLVRDHALVNRLGFNNGGHAAALDRLHKRGADGRRIGVVGVNIGANKDASDRTADYVAGLATFYDVASYFTVNISSPNTPGLRDLQAPAALDELLGRVMRERERLVTQGKPSRPIVVKIAPDIAEDDMPAICERLVQHRVDGIAVSNTTLSRPGLTEAAQREAGGLSGRPLFPRSTAMLARVYVQTAGKIPLIGIGGIDSPDAALAKLEAGASLLQLYTGLIYEGPGLIQRIKDRLGEALRARGLSTVAGLTGANAEAWAKRSLEN